MATVSLPVLTLTPPLPRSVYIETTSRCNSLCETCLLTFTDGGREGKKDLSWEEFRRIVDQFPVLERVVLHGIGEPLLNRHLTRMIRHSKERGAHVLFNTNAITLTPAKGEELIESGLDELRVSLDASTPATYAKIRGVDVLPKVLTNIEALAAAKARLGMDRPAVSLWFTALKENLHELPGLVPIAFRVRASSLHLQRLVYNGLGLAVKEQSVYRRLREEEEALIRTTREAARAARIEFSASGATAPEVSLAGVGDERPWSACRRPWILAYVTVHGNVLPCCIAPWIADPYEGIILGNLFEEPLEAIWSGARYREFRRAIQTDAPPQPCRGCGVLWSL